MNKQKEKLCGYFLTQLWEFYEWWRPESIVQKERQEEEDDDMDEKKKKELFFFLFPLIRRVND